ncbi:MAG: DUF4382 domain-containing protein [Bacteroidales bacterium]|nr:DUF4382 domain-containing protein [Bacteroidales bacterium]
MKLIRILMSLILVGSILVFTQCGKDDDDNAGVRVKMTDAPIDNAEVQGAFVTVSEVMIDGESVGGFSKQTIDLTAYQQGNTEVLLDDDMEVGSYNQLTMVLDYEQDASGNSPGCYVMTDDNEKHNLAATAQGQGEFTISNGFDVDSESTTDLVVDFNLRKAVTHSESQQSRYSFVTDAEMNNAMRMVVEGESGHIQGNAEDNYNESDKIVVYAYHKGEFNSSTETHGQGSSDVRFANAVTSAQIQGDGSYRLSFLDEGEYEIHCASYNEDSNGNVTFEGMLQANSTIDGLLLGSVNVEANSEVTLDLEITGLIGIK